MGLVINDVNNMNCDSVDFMNVINLIEDESNSFFNLQKKSSSLSSYNKKVYIKLFLLLKFDIIKSTITLDSLWLNPSSNNVA